MKFKHAAQAYVQVLKRILFEHYFAFVRSGHTLHRSQQIDLVFLKFIKRDHIQRCPFFGARYTHADVEHTPCFRILHAVLIDQCRMMGARRYPYLLHRAHETAVVSRDEHEQVTQMIVSELSRRGVRVRGRSNKQTAKDAGGRKRYGQ